MARRFGVHSPSNHSSFGSSDSLFRWHDFLLRDAAHPHEVDAHIRSHDGPLRWLLARRPPPHVVRSVLDAHRAAIFSAAARAANRRSETALHQACALGCPAEIVRIILEEDRSAAQRRDSTDRETPLHVLRDDEEATKALLEAHPRGVAAKDRFGCTPLHSAALYDSTAGPTRLLLQAGRNAEFGAGGGALEGNYRGKTPLGLACGYFTSYGCEAGEELGSDALNWWEKLEALVKEAVESFEDGSKNDMDGETERSLSDVSKSNSLNKCEGEDDTGQLGSSSEPQPFQMLHAVLELGCPTQVVLLTINMYTDQISQRDRMGRLPLHLACGGGRCRHYRRRQKFWKEGNKAQMSDLITAPAVATPAVIRALLDPQNGGYLSAAASVDSKGRLPLHILAMKGCESWFRRGNVSIVEGFLDEQDEFGLSEGGVLNLIFRAAPRALETRDITKGMHLFMLAAGRSGEGERKDEVADDCSHLDLVYCLLRKAPAVLMRLSLLDST
mmetsp:Transcript_56296/g.168550  ORF Transcript_56296/g.168550 Transcript_56296/m.168550 type:complete len:500 (-) Transcript_56296:93-1592(-)